MTEFLLISTGVFLNFLVEKKTLRDNIKTFFTKSWNRLMETADEKKARKNKITTEE